jgi:hypothetical protein
MSQVSLGPFGLGVASEAALSANPTTNTLPNAEKSAAYYQIVTILSGGVAPYSIVSSANVPEGLSLSILPDGVTVVISGVTEQAGRVPSQITFTVQDSGS